MLSFVLFKNKTAYEMRISDWSSDVCSSDLEAKIFPADSLEQCRLAGATSSMDVGRLLRRQLFRLLGEPDQRTSVDVMLPSRRTEWIDRACRHIRASIIQLSGLAS